MLPSKLVFVDIETTGTRAFYDRIIEIGILRVENNKIVDTFQTLINPESYIPKEITMITGISERDIENAPTFRQIKKDILNIFKDCIFVAHNVRFDYGFLKTEFDREDITFSTKHFCTVALSRMLYPQYRHHNLDSLIERHGFEVARRHRAYDDAEVLFRFYNKISSEFPAEVISKFVDKALKKPAIPLNLKTDINHLREKPGVYIFYGEKGAPLYIGKSKNIRQRVLSHFSSDIRSPLEMKISQQIETIETIETAGELGALLLESELIKKDLPLYNKRSRIKHELTALRKKVNKDGYEEIETQILQLNPKNSGHSEAADIISPDTVLGFFRSKKQAKSFLAETAKQFNLCEKLLGLEKTKGACFAHRLGRCLGACIGKEKALLYNLRIANAFATSKIKSWPFKGPVIIKESDGHLTEFFLVDKWCFLGKVKVDYEENLNNLIDQNSHFDLDVYKILKQFLADPRNFKNIRVLDTNCAAQI